MFLYDYKGPPCVWSPLEIILQNPQLLFLDGDSILIYDLLAALDNTLLIEFQSSLYRGRIVQFLVTSHGNLDSAFVSI